MRKGHFCLLFLDTTLITAWDGEKQKKTSNDKFDFYKKNKNKVLVMVYPLKPQDFSGAMATELHCFFDTVFSQILKIDHETFIFMDSWIHVNS